MEYWIISSLLMDRNMFHQVAGDLSDYIAISCDGEYLIFLSKSFNIAKILGLRSSYILASVAAAWS